jgi:tetratricopeptide (TPR) repeat protein
LVKHTADAKILFPNTPSFSFYNGMSNLMKKDYNKAVESLEQAKRISLENRDMQLEIFSQLGDAYYNLKDYEKSNQSFDEALGLDSNNGHVLNNYSYFLSLEKANLGKALRMSSKLILLFPDDATYLDTHGWVLFQNGDYSTAASYLEKAAKNSNSGVVWEHYGDALFKMNKQTEAIEAWKRAKELGNETSDQLEKKLKEKRL